MEIRPDQLPGSFYENRTMFEDYLLGIKTFNKEEGNLDKKLSL